MDRLQILDKYENKDDKLFVAKILDKIKIAKTKNQITNTDFLDMYQKKICQEILNIEKEKNYKFYYPCKEAEKLMLIIYPEKYSDLFDENMFDYSQFVKLIRITLPNQLKNTYTHRDYLSGLMKLGIKREKFGDILVFDDGADIVVSKEICEFLMNELPLLTRFSKSKIEEKEIAKIRKPIINKEQKRIVVASPRLDSVVAELANCSRTLAFEIIAEKRVFVNYENEEKPSKLINEGDTIVIRGKGKFKIVEVYGETRKNKIAILIEHYV